jgi:hypothetical protein
MGGWLLTPSFLLLATNSQSPIKSSQYPVAGINPKSEIPPGYQIFTLFITFTTGCIELITIGCYVAC